MKYINVRSISHEHVTRHADPEDTWDRDDTHTDWSFHDISIRDERQSWEDLSHPIPDDMFESGDTAICVIAVWSTGDSFGYDSCERAEIFGVYKTLEEAQAKERELIEDKSIMIPWNGYFENLEYITLHAGVVSDISK